MLNGITSREFGSGVRASAEALARIGLLILRNGTWVDNQLLPASYIAEATPRQSSVRQLFELDPVKFLEATEYCSLLWWTNNERTMRNVPKTAYWAWGLRDSLIIVMPELDFVVARIGEGFRDGWSPNYGVLEPLLNPMVDSVIDCHSEALLANAGIDSTAMVGQPIVLQGVGLDDGRPSGSALTVNWSQKSRAGADHLRGEQEKGNTDRDLQQRRQKTPALFRP